MPKTFLTTRARWCMTGFRYDPSSLHSSHPNIVIEAMFQKCQYCKALKWSGEPPGFCCCNGKVVLDDLACTPDLLSDLLFGQSSQSRHFLQHIRKYNSEHCLSEDQMPAFKVQGQVYHLIRSLLPKARSRHSFCRCISWEIVLKKLEEEEP
jgi:hypothetical protein